MLRHRHGSRSWNHFILRMTPWFELQDMLARHGDGNGEYVFLMRREIGGRASKKEERAG